MANVVRGDILNQDIKSVYIDVVCLYAIDDDGKFIYRLTEDTAVNPTKNYFRKTSDGTYVREVPESSPFGYYEELSIYLNSSHQFLFNDRYYNLAAFEIVEPDRTSVNQESGSFHIIGVTGEYIEMLQGVKGKLCLSVGLIKHDEIAAQNAPYILPPVVYEISNATIDSANAAISLSLQGGGLLGFYASKDNFDTANFPSLHG